MLKYQIIVILSLFVLCSCGEQKTKHAQVIKWEEQKIDPVKTTYTALYLKDSGMAAWKKYTQAQQEVILTINRIDAEHAAKADSLIVPSNVDAELIRYSPYPFNMPELKEVKKIIFFSYTIQAFGAYEYGKLVRWGATNMGSKNHQTPTGLYFTNWKAEETKSTFDDEWILKWNFNIENKEGIGWHQYAMPGYPASHSCLRLFESNAKYLYEWGDQWILKGEQNVLAQGTPVIVFGSYPFSGPKPWISLLQDPNALQINKDALQNEVSQHMQKIMHEQSRREQQEGSEKAD